MTPNQIRTLRKRLKLSGDAFAAELGLTGKHRGLQVYKWESGKRGKKPGPQTIMLMNILSKNAIKLR
jgi:DNA-binding transcriptional regulator YiaG